MIEFIRKIAWRILGINYFNFLKDKKHINLKDANWVQMGKKSYDNGAYVWRWNKNTKLIIGNYCSIAHDVHFLCDSGYHSESEVTTFPLFHEILNKDDEVIMHQQKFKVATITTDLSPLKQNIIVGNDVWIGARATILPGVTIGNGVTILAGSVVTENVLDYSIFGGVPAKLVKMKHDDLTIKRLNEIAWWHWSEEKVIKNVNDFYLPISDFIKKYN